MGNRLPEAPEPTDNLAGIPVLSTAKTMPSYRFHLDSGSTRLRYMPITTLNVVRRRNIAKCHSAFWLLTTNPRFVK